MTRFVVALSLAAAVVAAPASAFSFFSLGATTGPGPGDPGLGAYETPVVTFDAPLHAGVANTTTGTVALFRGTTPNVAAAPAGDTSLYQAVGTGGTSTFDFRGLEATQSIGSVSVYLGSIDAYNTVEILDRNLHVVGTITGSQLPGDNGDQGASITNRRLYISLTPADNFGGLAFASSGIAFEYDTIGVSRQSYPHVPNGATPAALPAVPEPAAWTLMIAGFALTGIAARRRRLALA